MVNEEPGCGSPQGGSNRGIIATESGQNVDSLFSPRFKSVAEMAGWDEETLLIASLVVEDTPERGSKQKKRSDLQFKTPPSSNSRRKRRTKRSPIPIPVVNLHEEVIENEEINMKNIETKSAMKREEKKSEGDELLMKNSCVLSPNPVLPCMDKLKEELSCAICLEICFEPSTTTCGHSFCKKCLRFATDKCGKRCPKCRQLISNGRSCTVNTVLWNTIQLLFPQEVGARKAAGAFGSKERSPGNPVKETRNSNPWRSVESPISSNRRRGAMRRGEVERFEREDLSRLVANNGEVSVRRRRGASVRPNQDEDAALAFRLQREEFMEAFNDQSRRGSSSISLARANLRAMASRAVQIRRRGGP